MYTEDNGMPESVSIKVVRLETQMATVVDAVSEVKELVKTVIVKVDNLTVLQGEVQDIRAEIVDLKRKSFRNAFVYPTVSAVAAALLTVLVISFIKHGGV